jgi:hypothetical protein
MGTKILSIVAAIQRLQITPAGWQTVKAPPLSELPIKPASGDFPLRIVSPVINRMQAKSSRPQTFGTGREYVWEIEDLFLYQSVTSTAGFVECAYPILEYVQAFSAVLETHVMLMQGVTIEDAPLEMGICEYPKSPNGSNPLYGFVCHTLKIREISE